MERIKKTHLQNHVLNSCSWWGNTVVIVELTAFSKLCGTMTWNDPPISKANEIVPVNIVFQRSSLKHLLEFLIHLYPCVQSSGLASFFSFLVNFFNFRPAGGHRQRQPQLPESRNLPSTDGTQTRLEINRICRLRKLIWISEYLCES